MNDLNDWVAFKSTNENFVYGSFKIVGMLEYLYLVSAYCIPVPKEIGNGFGHLNLVFSGMNNGWYLVVKNFARFIGSILAEVVSMDACVESWSGLCFG